MRDLTLTIRVYLTCCYVLGIVALAGLLLSASPPERHEWLLVALLAATAATAQLFVPETSDSRYSHQVGLVPVFAAILLLPAPLTALVVCAALVPEWIRYRRTWFMQLFKIASWLTASFVTAVVIQRLSAVHDASIPAYRAGTVLAGMIAFVLIHTLLQDMTVRLGSDSAGSGTGVTAPYRLLTELTFLCIGWFFALAWNVDPVDALPAAITFLAIIGAMRSGALRTEPRTDPGTGILTVAQLSSAISRELERARAANHPLTLLTCDVDLLRDARKASSRDDGNSLLHEVVDTIRHNIRGCDLTARFGTRELVIALPEVGPEAGREIAERIRAAFARKRFAAEPDGRPTSAKLNVGIASFPEHGDSFKTLFHEADLALFRAMREGRFDVAVAGGESRELLGEWLIYRGGEPIVDRFVPIETAESITHLRDFVKASNPFRHDLNLFSDLDEEQPSVDNDSISKGGERRKLTPEISIFVTTAVIFGIAFTLAIQARHYPRADLPWAGMALFIGLVVLAYRYAADIDARGVAAVTVVPMIAAGFLFNAYGVVLVAAASALVAKIKTNSSIHTMLFKFGCALLATSGAVLVFRGLTSGPLSHTPYLTMLLPGALAGMTFYLINHLWVCLIRSIDEHRSPVDIWRNDYLWLWPHYGVAGIVGMTLGATYEAMGVVVTLVMVSPIALMHLAMMQFVRRTSNQVRELRHINRQLGASYESTLQAISRALDTRDTETEEHSQRVRRYVGLIGRRCGLNGAAMADLSRGALLHDIGKIGVPDAILLKPGELSATELESMRRHPTIGYSMIAHIPFLAKSAEIVLHHHESFDGSGYPSGLAGEEIPLGARIFAVVDTLDAMTSDRPYRKALSFEEALGEIRRQSGQQFDPVIVDALLSLPMSELIRCRDGSSRDAANDRLAQPQGHLSPVPA